MSRVFWMALGAVGGIAAYRKSTQAVAQARELGALGSARAAASATSRLAGRTAHGLSRIEEVRDRRAGRLVVGWVESDEQVGQGGTATRPEVGPVPAGWVPAGDASGAGAGSPGTTPPADRRTGAPSVVILADGDTGAPIEPAEAPAPTWTPGSAGSATSRTTRPRRG